MMTFTVTFYSGSKQTFTGQFSYDASAVLRVTSDGKQTHYAPQAWVSVEHDAPDNRVSGQ